MKRGGWIVVVVVLCAGAAVFWWRNGDEHAQPAVAGEIPRPEPETAANTVSSDAEPGSAPHSPVVPSTSQPRDYAAQLRAATDYLEFTRSLLPAARAGDHAAQFYIFRALDYCALEYRFYVHRGRPRRSLDDALKWAATHWPYDSEIVRLVYNRCHTAFESEAKELDQRGEWLRRASDGDYPLAQVMAAKRQKLEGVSTAADDAARDSEGLRLVSLAIRSGDPEVMWEVGNSTFLDMSDEAEFERDDAAWLIAACQRGFDCSPSSDAVRSLCIYDPNCQPFESVSDVFRRGAGNEFPGIEARARWINEKLDAGDWEALGF